MSRFVLLASTAAVLALAGCSGPVRVDPPTPKGTAAAACEKLGAALPGRLDGAERVDSEPKSPYVAVWGAGEIALRCGVTRPQAMAATDEVSDVNGVGWFADPTRPALFTAVNRDAYIEVTISKKHVVGEILVDLADPIKATVPE